MDEDLDGIANTTALANDDVVQDMLKEVVKANDNREQQQQEQNDNRKRKDSSTGVSSNDNNERLRAGDKGGNRTSSSNSNGRKLPKPVRVLHILKKHVKSRRPSSWRVPKIAITKDKAIEDLNVLIEMLKEAEQSG